MAKKKTEAAKEAKAVTTKSVKTAPKVNDDGLSEIELLKDHGANKKGEKLFRHPNTAQLLIDRKIAK